MFDKLLEDLPIVTAFLALIMKFFEGKKETENIKEDIKELQGDIKEIKADTKQNSRDIANINGKLSK